MAISYIGTTSNEGDTITLPTHDAKDLIIVIGSSTNGNAVSAPAGWKFVWTYNINTGRRFTAGYKIAATNAETSGTWTNSAILLSAVYRDDTNYLDIGNFSALQAGTGTTVTYSNSNFPFVGRATSWIVGYASCNSRTLNIEDAPSGMTNRVSLAHSSSALECALHDTNGATTWTSQTVTLTSVSSNATLVLDLYDTGISKTGGGGGGVRMVNIRGGADQ